MTTAQDVEFALLECLEVVALQCQERRRRSADWHIVKDFDATNASLCEASCAAHVINNDGFNPDVSRRSKRLHETRFTAMSRPGTLWSLRLSFSSTLLAGQHGPLKFQISSVSVCKPPNRLLKRS